MSQDAKITDSRDRCHSAAVHAHRGELLDGPLSCCRDRLLNGTIRASPASCSRCCRLRSVSQSARLKGSGSEVGGEDLEFRTRSRTVPPHLICLAAGSRPHWERCCNVLPAPNWRKGNWRAPIAETASHERLIERQRSTWQYRRKCNKYLGSS